MNIVVAGAGAVGTHLARLLSDEKQNITLIDGDEEKLSLLGANLDLLTVLGSATSIESLKEAGISKTDLFIAVTP
ncbi:MAG: NAD-binding protein, partial [Bacteroides sp.]|nr:NAD-binding protein [Bacteroides sp.]MDD4720970.1 NAD-binding protein [Bacteroides sp.]